MKRGESIAGSAGLAGLGIPALGWARNIGPAAAGRHQWRQHRDDKLRHHRPDLCHKFRSCRIAALRERRMGSSGKCVEGRPAPGSLDFGFKDFLATAL